MKAENNFDNPRPFASFTEEELATFSGVFIPGGHAPLTDLGDDPDLGRILLHFHQNQKPTGAFAPLQRIRKYIYPPSIQPHFATAPLHCSPRNTHQTPQALPTKATASRRGPMRKRGSLR